MTGGSSAAAGAAAVVRAGTAALLGGVAVGPAADDAVVVVDTDRPAAADIGEATVRAGRRLRLGQQGAQHAVAQPGDRLGHAPQSSLVRPTSVGMGPPCRRPLT